jgi:hypothetical protein
LTTPQVLGRDPAEVRREVFTLMEEQARRRERRLAHSSLAYYIRGLAVVHP